VEINDILKVVSYGIGVPLELIVVVAMIRSHSARSLPFVFAYSVALVPLSLNEGVLFLMNASRRAQAMAYWIGEGIGQLLIFAAVISMIYVATATLEKRVQVRQALLSGAILFAVLSVALHYDPAIRNGKWMGLVSRDLNFCSAILDMALWTLLLLFQRQQHRLLLLSGGLGIQFTLTAIGHSMRQMLPAVLVLGNVLIVVASFACLYVWWQAFRTSPVPTPPGTVPVQSGR
jgi:hypothetical protein